MKYATRSTFVAATLSVAASITIALLIQLGLLGALGTAISARDIVLAPVANVEAVKSADGAALLFDTSRGPAVAQARSIQVAAKDVLAVTVRTSDVTGNVRGIFGWLSTHDLRRSASTPVAITSGNEAKTTTVLLAGHPRWRETLTQIGLGFEGRAGQPGGALVREFDVVPAHPMGGLQLLAGAWFGKDVNLIKPTESASRLLPLALWFVFASLLSVASLVLIYRRSPSRRAASLQAVMALLGTLAVVLTLFGNQWPGGSSAVVAAMAAIAALWLIEPLPQIAGLSQSKRWLIAAGLAIICAIASPWVAAVACIPAVILVVNQLHPGAWSRWATLALAAPLLALCAIAQKMIAAPPLFATLSDPTSALASVATSSAGLPGFAVGLLMAHHFWPSPAQATRWSNAGAAATGWALAGALLVLSVPGIAAMAADKATLVSLFLPFFACLLLAARPKFLEIAATFTDTEPVLAKTEEDLSAQALTLLESHAERVRNALQRGQTGAARAALNQMQAMAPAARTTARAELAVTLATGDLNGAGRAAATLGNYGSLSVTEADALLELAHRQDHQARVIELAPLASQTQGNVRALALAQLRELGPTQALATLSAWSDERTFAREIAELHLLGDDIQGAQQAMVNTGISLTDPVGEAYIARIGLRVQGASEQAAGVAQLALWHPQVGAAQAAQGEILMRQGNLAGARARLLLAMRLDPALWPLQKLLQTIDAQLATRPQP